MIGKQRTWLVRLRPRADTLHVSQGSTILATGRDGFIVEKHHGLFFDETRLLCRYRYLIDGEQPMAIALSNVEQHNWLGYYASTTERARARLQDQGSGMMEALSEYTLELRLSRYVGDGVHEDVDLTNFTRDAVTVTLALEVDADFAGLTEVERPRRQQGKLTREWRRRNRLSELAFDYRAEHSYKHQGERGTARLHRGLILRVLRSSSEPSYSRRKGIISWKVKLKPRATWHACLELLPVLDGDPLPARYGCRSFFGVHNEYDRRRQRFHREATGFHTPASETLASLVSATLEQSQRDLAALRLYHLDREERAWTVAAGLPIYVALYGRDVLTTAWQSATASRDLMKGALAVIADYQGRQVNDWRDEQPGRMVHEVHTGPPEVLNYNPRARYYGATTTSAFYPVVVAELWHWTGDAELVRPFIPPALEALRWLDKWGDLNRDGFYDYKTRSRQGTRNQGWKDSPDAIVYPDGSLVEPPISTCEEQAFAYGAKFMLSELLWWLGDKDDARRLYRQAGELKKRFNQKFWMKDEGTIAMGLDRKGRQIKSLGSDPGHCVAAGIVDSSLVERVVDRLFAPDLFSGWGIRTLSSDNPAYNPFSYHRGSVWPAEHGTFSLGLFRYGLYERMHTICRSMFEAAALFDHYRLPEVFSGHPRGHDHPFPAIYPQANWPQAWSASSVFLLVQSMLGLYPYAPLRLLALDPHLPEWLPEITLSRLRVGDARVTIRFWRDDQGASHYRILEQEGTLHVVRQPSPWSLTSSYAERIVDALSSLLPGR